METVEIKTCGDPGSGADMCLNARTVGQWLSDEK